MNQVCSERKNGVILTKKLESQAELKFELGFQVNFDSNSFQILGIPGRTLVQPVTQLFRSK